MGAKKAPTQISKREKFEKAGRFPVKKAVIAGLVVVIVVVGAFMAYRLTAAPEVGGAVVEQGGADYGKGNVNMTVLNTATVADGNLKIPVADIKANRIVGVLYNRSTPMPEGFNQIVDNGLPILAYVAPSGKLVVATSLCEPCRSWEFHIEGNELVCNACFTRWDLNTLEGKNGGCLTYPPKELTTVVQGTTVDVSTDALESWLPRT